MNDTVIMKMKTLDTKQIWKFFKQSRRQGDIIERVEQENGPDDDVGGNFGDSGIGIDRQSKKLFEDDTVEVRKRIQKPTLSTNLEEGHEKSSVKRHG